MTLTPETIAELRGSWDERIKSAWVRFWNDGCPMRLRTKQYYFERGFAYGQADVPTLLDDIESYRKALEEIRNAATSFCDCDGDFVASQVTIRVDAALGGEHDR